MILFILLTAIALFPVVLALGVVRDSLSPLTVFTASLISLVFQISLVAYNLAAGNLVFAIALVVLAIGNFIGLLARFDSKGSGA